MDLYKEWDTLNQTKFNINTINKQEIMEAINHKSQLSLSVLKKRLKYKIYWITLFVTLATIWMLFSLKDPELLMILAVPLLLNGVALVLTTINYRKINADDALTLNTTQAIKTNVAIIKNTLRAEIAGSVFFTPLSVIYGLLLGNHLTGHSVSSIIHNPALVIVGIICMVIIVPLGIISGVKMNEKAFGEHLDHLQKNIIQLETLEA